MIRSLRLLTLAAAAVSLSACYNPDGTVNPAGTALAGAAVGAAAGVAVGAAANNSYYYRPTYYRPAYYRPAYYGYRPYGYGPRYY